MKSNKRNALRFVVLAILLALLNGCVFANDAEFTAWIAYNDLAHSYPKAFAAHLAGDALAKYGNEKGFEELQNAVSVYRDMKIGESYIVKSDFDIFSTYDTYQVEVLGQRPNVEKYDSALRLEVVCKVTQRLLDDGVKQTCKITQIN
jgi:hypothetical protein